jgi:hypothetical protein
MPISAGTADALERLRALYAEMQNEIRNKQAALDILTSEARGVEKAIAALDALLLAG